MPKVKNPTTPGDFRLISLCNVTFKIITKTIANRTKHILDNIIIQSQSVFIPDRLITYNIIIAYESFHYLRKNNSNKKGYAGFKPDMAKAYDNTVKVMDFSNGLVKTIVQCVYIVSYSTIINGSNNIVFFPFIVNGSKHLKKE